MAKNKNLHVRLSEETYNTIRDYCVEHNVNQSEYIRQLVEQDQSELTLKEHISSLEYEINGLQEDMEKVKNKLEHP